ncbi:AAA family ATPase [Oscillatoria sp. FACHB-1406]|uniref:AAA family ATPase n=1 Tax=Oscillatoria sp. FACHB-1406 TaxID=2692846 RepID=UPI0016897277|nr:AAA family ATPase [Oscillatoria sp. FACHB-1406]MBD2578628.1 AAA family ATPase [Oscillatoria sp. FACHB-1406]
MIANNRDRYQIISKIYESANSIVYRAIWERDDRPIILKILKEDYPTVEELTRYKQEYEITRSLNLEGVVKVYDLQRYQNSLAMFLEDFGGESLKFWMAQRKFTLEEFIIIARQIAETLSAIHAANIIHKDINPSNIVYNPETGQLKIIDFGISAILSQENPTLTSIDRLEGTLAYISPEQTGRMNRAIDSRSDLYSLGITFYQLLTHRLPFETAEPMELVHSHIAKQAIAPHLIDSHIPKAISDIVLKLMSKTAEERYSSALGLKADLEICWQQLQSTGQIAEFPLGERDIPTRLQISQKLYGREEEIAGLLSAFEQVVQGKTEMALLAGYSGVGKSAIVNELRKLILQQGGNFISGKFDQYTRNIPYAALIQAFQGLIRQLLAQSEAQIQIWKQNLLEALGSNGQILINAIPELESILGKQPPIPSLGPTESQNRFNLVFQKFIGVFTKKEHPLVIFLDDLQWADLASLKALELLMSDRESQYLLIVGAYRDNEVTPTHPLMQTLEQVQNIGLLVRLVPISPLQRDCVSQLIADTLGASPEKVKTLVDLVFNKTDGNPFFVTQLLNFLYTEGLLYFDSLQWVWKWNIEQIQAVETSQNVVELTIGKMRKLAPKTQNILKLAACVGNQFDLEVLAVVNAQSISETAIELYPALQEGLVLPLSDAYKIPLHWHREISADNAEFSPTFVPKYSSSISYRFLHDRVQQAAYALIPEERKKEVHLRIGQLLLENIASEKLEDRIFSLVNHFNIGQSLIAERSQRHDLARFNLIAARKAKSAAAYESALKYLETGIVLLSYDSWEDTYELTLSLHLELVEMQYVTTQFEAAEQFSAIILERAKTLLDRIKVYELKILSHIARMELNAAVDLAIKVLELLEIVLPKEPTIQQVNAAQESIELLLKNKQVENLFNLPDMKDSNKLAAVRILLSVSSAAIITTPLLYSLVIMTEVNLCIAYGNAPQAAGAYIYFGTLLCAKKDVESGYRFGKLSLRLLEETNRRESKSLVLHYLNGFIRPWKESIRNSNIIEMLREALNVGLETGDIETASFNASAYCLFSLFAGIPLDRVIKRYEKYIKLADKLKQAYTVFYMKNSSKTAKSLLEGYSERYCLVAGDSPEEEEKLLEQWTQEQAAWLLFSTYLAKTISYYFFKDYDLAIVSTIKADEYAASSAAYIVAVQHNFYHSLAILAGYFSNSSDRNEEALERVSRNQEILKIWASHCPENFQHKYQLVEAERARLLGQNWEATELYEQAILGAREGGFIHEEALASERAAEFYFSLGRKETGRFYLNDAYFCYSQWGAKAKVKKLEEDYSQYLLKSNIHNKSNNIDNITSTTDSTVTTTGSNGKGLDLNTIVKASQTISGEIDTEKLLQKLMKIVIENAGAQKGLLLLETAGNWAIEAEGTVDVEDVRLLRSLPIDTLDPDQQTPLLSASIVNYVARTQESIVLNDATQEGQFINDPYILAAQPKSVLCAPIINQGKLIGIVYLENNLTTGAFTADRLAVLSILSAQASISIENAQLYQNLEQKVEERTEELATANAEILVLNERLRAENLRMSAELEVTRRLQQMILPKPAELEAIEGITISGFMEPAEEVGGDYYDVLRRGDKAMISIGDVTGHGLESGVLMIMAQTAIRTLLTQGETNPAKFLQTVNQTIFDNVERMDANKNMSLSLLEYQNQSLRLSGQHEEAIVVRNDGEVERIDTIDLGFPLGLEADISDFIASTEIPLNSGDVVVLYTDGITEAFDINNVEYGIERLIEVVVQNRGREAAEIERAVIEDVRQYIGEQKVFDDITLVVIKKS